MLKETIPTYKTVEYQGYSIQSAPRHLNGEKWGMHIFISLQDHRGVRTRQFSTDAVYADEQEAEIHGITFGQRVIDGKVEGHSVFDMKTSNRRGTPRLRVQFRTAFAVSSSLQGVGVLLDLSLGGCRVESPVIVEPGVSLELHIYAPDLGWPVMIEAATVQWVNGQRFGLAFFRVTDDEQQRLGKIVNDLREEG